MTARRHCCLAHMLADIIVAWLTCCLTSLVALVKHDVAQAMEGDSQLFHLGHQFGSTSSYAPRTMIRAQHHQQLDSSRVESTGSISAVIGRVLCHLWATRHCS